MDSLHWKIFIKQSQNEPQESVERHVAELNFRGQEARIAYESIVNESSKKTDVRSSRTFHIPRKTILTFKTRGKSDISQKQKLKINANTVLKAVEQGDLKFLEDNLEVKYVNIADNFGWTPLISAAYCGNTKIVKFLLKMGADRWIKDKSGHTALDFATKKNHSAIITSLKSKKLDVEKKKKDITDTCAKMTEFHCSICNNNFKEASIQQHEASTLHIFNTNPKIPDPVYGIPKDNRGYQIMLNNGWEEKKGLGPNGSGLKYPVKTILKRDRKGLGKEIDKEARVTHFKSGDVRAIAHVKQSYRTNTERPFRRKDRVKFLSREAKRERAIRRALS